MNDALPATRLYAGAIAIVSGVYSLASATTGFGSGMTVMGGGVSLGGWAMLVVGVVVLVHGVVLLTPVDLGGWSGPLMIAYAVVMLLNQTLGATMTEVWMGGGRMRGPMDGSMMDGAVRMGMGWDLGMVALAVLMLASGIIMTSYSDDGM